MNLEIFPSTLMNIFCVNGRYMAKKKDVFSIQTYMYKEVLGWDESKKGGEAKLHNQQCLWPNLSFINNK